MNWKGFEKNWSWPKRYFPDIFLEGLRKANETPVRIASLRPEL
jgi:hypothetical protein